MGRILAKRVLAEAKNLPAAAADRAVGTHNAAMRGAAKQLRRVESAADRRAGELALRQVGKSLMGGHDGPMDLLGIAKSDRIISKRLPSAFRAAERSGQPVPGGEYGRELANKAKHGHEAAGHMHNKRINQGNLNWLTKKRRFGRGYKVRATPRFMYGKKYVKEDMVPYEVERLKSSADRFDESKKLGMKAKDFAQRRLAAGG